jgi:hypothetical protein
MRITALSLFLASVVFAAPADTPLSTIAKLAGYLSQGDGPDAIGVFDSHMKGFGDLEQNINALASQSDVSCAIDPVEDTESNGVHKLDLDWYMEVKSQLDNSVERRRERVQVEMRQIKGRWKITSLSPVSILDPMHPQP